MLIVINVIIGTLLQGKVVSALGLWLPMMGNINKEQST
jgi:hypothetical protein